MSKAFTNEDQAGHEAELPLPVGRRSITPQGFAAMKRQLNELVTSRRPPLLLEAAEGAADAQASLRAVERRIVRLERTVSLCDVAELPSRDPHRVTLGTRVIVEGDQDEPPFAYSLVGPDEVDVQKKRISVASPVGRALFGLQVGDRAFIKRPKGVLEVRILAIEADPLEEA